MDGLDIVVKTRMSIRFGNINIIQNCTKNKLRRFLISVTKFVHLLPFKDKPKFTIIVSNR